MFLVFFVLLIGGAFVPIVLFSSGETIGLDGLGVSRAHSNDSSLQRAIGSGRILTRAYIWFGWAAYCAWLALRFVSESGVVNPWVYFVTALVVTSVPIAYLHRRDQMSATSDEEHGQLQSSTNLWRVLLLVGCVSFLVAPQLMTVPYGWFAHAERQVTADFSREITQWLHAAQEGVIPSTQDSQPITPTAAHRVPPDASETIIRGHADEERHTANAGEELCEQEQPGQRDLESASETDGPCVSLAEPASRRAEGE